MTWEEVRSMELVEIKWVFSDQFPNFPIPHRCCQDASPVSTASKEGAGRQEYGEKFLALTVWLGLCRAQSRDQMQKKAKLPMPDFPPTFTGPALLYHTGKNSHQHASVTSHRVCTWINTEHVFTGPDSSSYCKSSIYKLYNSAKEIHF